MESGKALDLKTQNLQLVAGLQGEFSPRTRPQGHVYKTLFLNPGDVLFSHERSPRGLYFVQSGCLKLLLNAAFLRGRRQTGDFLARLVSAGEYLGSLQMLNQEELGYEAIVVRPSVVWYYTPEAVNEMLSAMDPVMRGFLKQTLEKQHASDVGQQSLYLASVRERVAHQLIVLADRFGIKGPTGIVLNLKLSRYEFGQLAGTVNESFSRYLSEFKDEGYVDIRGREIVITDLQGLLNCAGVDGDL